jgi:flagellin-like hook-associated protein FlgL
LEALSLALGADSAPDIQASISDLDAAFDAVQMVTADLGGRMNRVDHALENLDSLEVELLTQRSDLQDTDMEEAITKLVNRQVTYQSAMLANSRILNLTLTDYLR